MNDASTDAEVRAIVARLVRMYDAAGIWAQSVVRTAGVTAADIAVLREWCAERRAAK